MSKDEAIVICMYADSPDLLPGGILGHTCADCGKELMVAQSTMNLLESKGVTDPIYLCLSCVTNREFDDVKVIPPSKEQIDEVINHIKKS